MHVANDSWGRYYSKASSLAVPFKFCSSNRGTDIIYMTAPVYITYMVALLDFTLLHTAMKNVCVLAVWAGRLWKKKKST